MIREWKRAIHRWNEERIDRERVHLRQSGAIIIIIVACTDQRNDGSTQQVSIWTCECIHSQHRAHTHTHAHIVFHASSKNIPFCLWVVFWCFMVSLRIIHHIMANGERRWVYTSYYCLYTIIILYIPLHRNPLCTSYTTCVYGLLWLHFFFSCHRTKGKKERRRIGHNNNIEKINQLLNQFIFHFGMCVLRVCVLAICAPLPYHQHHCIRTHWPLRMGKSSEDFCCCFGSFRFYSSPSYLTKTRTNEYGNGAVDSCVELSPPMSDKLNGETIQYQHNNKKRILPSIDCSNNRRHFLCCWQFVPTRRREREREEWNRGKTAETKLLCPVAHN